MTVSNGDDASSWLKEENARLISENTRLQSDLHGLYEKLRQVRAAILMVKLPAKLKADILNIAADPRRVGVKMDPQAIMRAMRG